MSIIVFTKHALEMLTERELQRAVVESAVRVPDWKEISEGEIWHAFKRIEGKVLRVVLKGRVEPFTVITVYFDRRLKT